MKCENCDCEHDGSYGSGRFCSAKCARSFSTVHSNKEKIKTICCTICHDNVIVKKQVALNNFICKECRHKLKIGKSNKCSICGDTVLYKTGGCKNEFCTKHPLKQIKTLIKYFGFDKNKLGTHDVEIEFDRIRNILFNDYWNDNMTSTDLGKKYNYPSPCNLTGKVFKYLNIPIRNLKDAIHLNYLSGKMNIMNGYHTCKEEWHKTWDGYDVFLRSSYETDFANELDKNQIHYEVESLRIKYFDTQLNKYRCAVPDFYIPSTNTIYEIKSTWTYNAQNMKDKFEQYKKMGYTCILVLNHVEIKII